jgi:hypothetical protein
MVNLPPVASNRPDLGKTVAGAINEMLKQYRLGANGEKKISIATAYINPAGYALIADELNTGSRVRLLIGAEPEFDADRSVTNGDNASQKVLKEALSSHESWLAAERDLSGFTREALASAQAMVEWLEKNVDGTPLVEVRRFQHGFLHGKSFMVEADLSASAIAGSSNFTQAGLSTNAELNLATSGTPGHVQDIGEWFDHYWNQSQPYELAELYKTQWAPHQPWPVFLRMLQELYGNEMNEEGATGRLGLTNFQRDGVARMKRLLAQNGGVLVADEVGLGKSFLAGEVIKTATEDLFQRAVIICPASIKRSMWLPFLKDNHFSHTVEVYSYEEVRGRIAEPKEPDADASQRELAKYKKKHKKWRKFSREMSEYALVVVDEAHNLRNSSAARSEALDKVILSGKNPKQVVLLTATPVNNSLTDLETLLKYFVRNDAQFAHIGIPSIRGYIKRAQDTDPENLTPEHLFDLMDQVAVRRTRKFVKDNYANDKVIIRGEEQTIKFPTAKSYRIEYELDEAGLKLVDSMLYALEVDESEGGDNSYWFRRGDEKHLMLARYTPSAYRLEGDLENHQITNAGLLRSALLKRLESSPAALYKTLKKLSSAHAAFIKGCENGYVIVGSALSELTNTEDDEFMNVLDDFDVENRKDIEVITLYKGEMLIEDVKSDKKLIDELAELARLAHQGSDPKYNELVKQLMAIAEDSKKVDANGVSSQDRRKVIVFSTFADTIMDLHERLTAELKTSTNVKLGAYKERLAPPIMGTYAAALAAGETGGVDQGGRTATIAGFAPITAGEYVDGKPVDEDEFDILLTTDVLAEGVNLQQAGRILNYDLPWNPMRIVQRHGRIDRIGSEHDYVHLGLYFPSQKLDEMLKLESTLQRKLAQAHAAVGEHIEVLAKTRQKTEVILHDKSMKKMDAFLESRGGDNAISGEEFRRRLYKYLMDHPNGNEASKLPYGSGSGFVNPKVEITGYAFCVKVAKHEKPWFRFIKTDADWNPLFNEDGKPVMSGESLVALKAADPGAPNMERTLSDDAYSKAFDAWQIAQESILADWNFLADSKNVGAQPPASFRRAYEYVAEFGDFLEPQSQLDLLARLSAVPSKKVELAVGRAMRVDTSKREIIESVIQVLDDAGIQAQPKAETLPAVNTHEVRLVAWMAVQGVPAKLVVDS